MEVGTINTELSVDFSKPKIDKQDVDSDFKPRLSEKIDKLIGNSDLNNEVIRKTGEEVVEMLTILGNNKEATLDSSVLKKLYSFLESDKSEIKNVFLNGIRPIIALDLRNISNESYLGIYESLDNFLLNKIDLSIEKKIDIFDYSYLQKTTELVFFEQMKRSKDEVQIRDFFVKSANRIGFEKCRRLLKKEVEKNPDFKEKYDLIEKVMDFKKGKKSYSKLENLYEDISFENYQPNSELQDFENDLLISEFGKNKTILDVGCGPEARNMRSLGKDNEVYGIDLVQKHVDLAKEKYGLKVYQADWHHMPFENDKFDGLICLGRAFLHNTSVIEGVYLLDEMKRVLKKNSASEIIIDLPNPTKGGYAKNLNGFNQELSEKGIKWKEEGTIIDGPDSEHVFDRLILSDEQFQMMARVSEFEAKKIVARNYKDGLSEDVDENVYWRLTLRDNSHPFSFDDKIKNIEKMFKF